MNSFFQNAFSLFRENPLRGFLSLFALVAGSFLLASSWGISDGINRLIEAQNGTQGLVLTLSNGTLAADGSYERTFPPQFDSKIGDLVKAALPQSTKPSPVEQVRFDTIAVGDQQYRIRRVLGVGESYLETMGLKLIAGSGLTAEDITARKTVILMTEEVAKTLFGSAQDAVGKTIDMVTPARFAMRIQGGAGTAAVGATTITRNRGTAATGLQNLESSKQKFTIGGVYQTPDSATRSKFGLPDAVLAYTASQPGGFQVPENFFWGSVVFNAKGESLDTARAKLTAAVLAEKGADAKAAVWQGNPQNPDVKGEDTAKALRALVAMITALGLILVLVSGVGMYGIMTVEVAGRSRQYGIRRALGTSVSQIYGLVAKQSVSLAAFGALIGIVVAALLSGLLLGQLAPWFQLVGLRTETLATIGFNPLPYLEALVALLVASGLFGVLPALRLRKTEPISLLREEAA
ncbi:MAG: FtsX-like permease family protein [Spirochaetales bacterium]